MNSSPRPFTPFFSYPDSDLTQPYILNSILHIVSQTMHRIDHIPSSRVPTLSHPGC